MLEALGRAHQTRYTGHTIPYRWFSCIFTPLLTAMGERKAKAVFDWLKVGNKANP
jgi:hypothetical protein